MDALVLKTQQWLNKTYGGNPLFGSVKEDGFTGWKTIYGLTRALQIELGMSSTGDSFGPSTRKYLAQKFSKGITEQSSGDTEESNIYSIIQCALWCKGYATGKTYEIIRHFNSDIGEGVKQLRSDMGLSDSNATVTVDIMAGLLSMDQYVLMWRQGGMDAIRKIQQKLNQTYENYLGLIPCDGLYGRALNKALIVVLQAIEGYSPAQANGSFGANTKAKLPILPDSDGKLTESVKGKATQLLRYALCCNGFCTGTTSEEWDKELDLTISEFQKRYGLEESGKADVNTWMSLLLSKGNPDRTAQACDCSTILDAAKAKALYDAGYRCVGRYLTGTVGGTKSKALTKEELTAIFHAGLKVFAIYQDNSPSVGYFTKEQGKKDASSAFNAARNLGVPFGETIFFAVDYDMLDNQIISNVIPYFEGIYDAMGDLAALYDIGVYGSRNVCTRVSNKSLASSSFVADMSTGYSGNMGFAIPSNWAFDQFDEYTFSGNGDRFGIDKDGYSKRYVGFQKLEQHNTGGIPDTQLESVYESRYKYLLSQFGVVPLEITWDAVQTIPLGEVTLMYRGGFKSAYQPSSGALYSPVIEITNGSVSAAITSQINDTYSKLDPSLQAQIDTSKTVSLEEKIQNGSLQFGFIFDGTSLVYHVLIQSDLIAAQLSGGTVTHSLFMELKFIMRKFPDDKGEFADAVNAYNKLEQEHPAIGTTMLLVGIVALAVFAPDEEAVEGFVNLVAKIAEEAAKLVYPFLNDIVEFVSKFKLFPVPAPTPVPTY